MRLRRCRWKQASHRLIALMPDMLFQGQTDAMFANAGLQAITRMRVSSTALALSDCVRDAVKRAGRGVTLLRGDDPPGSL